MVGHARRARMNAFVGGYLLCFSFALLSGCNDEQHFVSGTAPANDLDVVPEPTVEPTPTPTPPLPPPPVVPEDVLPFTSLQWNLNCVPEGSSVPESVLPEGGEAQVYGVGPHSFSPKQLVGTTVHIAGDMCQPKIKPRRFTLVLDASSSMENMTKFLGNISHSGNDAMNGGTCGRLEATRALLRTFSAAGFHEFAVVTFSDGIVLSSSAFFKSEDALFQDLLARYSASGFKDLNDNGSTDIVDLLCAGVSGTNYQAGLEQAESLLFAGVSEGSSSEIYFVSDGQPNAGKSGVEAATRIKNRGATIATMMLNGDDEILKNQIASRDAFGTPYHSYVQAAGELAKTLASLADNEITDGWVEISAIGGFYNERFQLNFDSNDLSFVIPELAIDPSDAPSGLEVSIEYWDRIGNTETVTGRLLWSSAQP